MNKYYIVLTRIVRETTITDITAANHEEARKKVYTNARAGMYNAPNKSEERFSVTKALKIGNITEAT